MRFLRTHFFSRMTPEELTHIIDGCKKERPKQQEALFNAYSAVLYGICCRYIGDRDDAEDVLQETFIKIFLNIKHYKQSGSFEGWMKKIAVNSALYFLKHKKKLQFDAVDIGGLSAGEETGSEVDEEMDEQFLLECIHELPLGYKTVLNLYLVEEFSHKDIAEQLGIKESTSRSQYTKARRQLAELIKKRQSTIHEGR